MANTLPKTLFGHLLHVLAVNRKEDIFDEINEAYPPERFEGLDDDRADDLMFQLRHDVSEILLEMFANDVSSLYDCTWKGTEDLCTVHELDDLDGLTSSLVSTYMEGNF